MTTSAVPATDPELAAAETLLAAGDLDAARHLLDSYLAGHPGDPAALEFERRLGHAERSRAQALAAGDLLGEIEGAPSELEDAQPTEGTAETAGAQADRDRAAAGLVQDDPPDAESDAGGAERARLVQDAPPAAPVVPLRQLVQRARQHRANDEFHSLRQVIRQIQARDRQGRLDDELEAWAKKVDGWVRDRDGELKEAVSDLLDEFADVVEDEDMEDLEELWDDRIDSDTQRFFRQYWETYRKTKAEIELRSVEPWDHEAKFEAVVHLYGRTGRTGKSELVRTVTWRGRIRDQGGARMILPFPG